jgi:hypothetical protein
MRVLLGLAFSIFYASAAQAEQPLPPGRYCGFVDLAHLGMVVHPTQADGKIRVSVSSLWNQEDWGGTTRKTTAPLYRVFTHNFPLEGVFASDGTLNLWNGKRYSFTGLHFQNGNISGKWSPKGDVQFWPVNLGECSRFPAEEIHLLFD